MASSPMDVLPRGRNHTQEIKQDGSLASNVGSTPTNTSPTST